MSLIFHKFKDDVLREAFITAVRNHGIRADVWESRKEFDEAGLRAFDAMKDTPGRRNHPNVDPLTGKECDQYPFELVPPIVCVERNKVIEEALIMKMAEMFCGEFAGT
jgi:hypothetical protein